MFRQITRNLIGSGKRLLTTDATPFGSGFSRPFNGLYYNSPELAPLSKVFMDTVDMILDDPSTKLEKLEMIC